MWSEPGCADISFFQEALLVPTSPYLTESVRNPLYLYVGGEGGSHLLNVMSFRKFLNPLSCLLPEHNECHCRITFLFPLRTFCAWLFKRRWMDRRMKGQYLSLQT